MACTHERPEGVKRCKECSAAYFREWRKTRKTRAMKQARREGREELRAEILERLEGDLAELEMNGGSAAEIIRWIGLYD